MYYMFPDHIEGQVIGSSGIGMFSLVKEGDYILFEKKVLCGH